VRISSWKDRVIVEVKSVEHLARQHAKQLLTYLKLTNTPVGLLINFGAPTLRAGLRRLVNGFQPSAFPRLRVNQGVPANANNTFLPKPPEITHSFPRRPFLMNARHISPS
jgi:iron complex transport system substrate-binding protein